MAFIGRILISAVAAIIAAYFLNGVHIDNSVTAILLALVLSLLNSFVKPILIILTIPITILTLGLFLLVLNVLMIEWAAKLIPGFTVDSWWAALWFSLLLSFVNSLLLSLTGHKNNTA
ncbi:MAG: phage holin family protein [Bacteroidetes bacterium]|nr:phage holin family protein [Bacteroidota bacterium]